MINNRVILVYKKRRNRVKDAYMTNYTINVLLMTVYKMPEIYAKYTGSDSLVNSASKPLILYDIIGYILLKCESCIKNSDCDII